MKQFWKPEAWKFAVLVMLVLAAYAVFRANEPLDFHESWSPAERQQIEACFQTCCDPHSPVNEAECAAFIQEYFPRHGSWVDRSVQFIYTNLGSYSRNLVFGYLNKSTRRMIEETASSGNVLLKDRLDRSLLIWSLAYGFNDLAVSLIERGADVHLHSLMEDGSPADTPLSWAVSIYTAVGERPLSECRRLVECLLAHGADLKAPGVSNYPVTLQALANTISSRNKTKDEDAEEFLIELLEKGAPSEWKNSSGEPVYLLRHAVTFKKTRLIRYLLDHGADPSVLPVEQREELKTILKGKPEGPQDSCLQGKDD